MIVENPFIPFEMVVSIGVSPVINQRTRKFCVVSANDTTIDTGTMAEVDITNYASKLRSPGSNSVTENFLKSFFSQNGTNNKACFIYEAGSTGTTAQKLQALKTFILEHNCPCWAYYIPDSLTNDTEFGSLTTFFNNSLSQTYFMVETKSKPAQYTQWNSYCKGKKSVMGFYNNILEANSSLAGCAMGVMASTFFDVSLSVPLTSLNLKKVNATPSFVAMSDIKEIQKAPMSNIGNVESVKENVIGGGLFADENPFEFWYAFDTVTNRLNAELGAFMVSGQNTIGTSLTFDDLGIKTGAKKIENVLNTCIDMKLINKFGKSQDLATGEILDIGSISYIPEVEYKMKEPEKAKAGIYDGYSAVVEIMGMIRKIVFNISTK